MGIFAVLVGAGLAWTPSSRPEPAESADPQNLEAEDRGEATAVENSGPATDGAPAEDTDPKRPQSDTGQRVREGTEITDRAGAFRLSGDRVTFVPDDQDKVRLTALENLNLERVLRVMTDNPQPLKWVVTGTVTEFRGANYLFVRRAVLKTRVASAEDAF